MRIYDGPVTLILDDGTEVPAVAALSERRGLHGTWGGAVRTADGDALYRLGLQVNGRLRFPDGREAGFVAGDQQLESGRMPVSGEGDVPF